MTQQKEASAAYPLLHAAYIHQWVALTTASTHYSLMYKGATPHVGEFTLPLCVLAVQCTTLENRYGMLCNVTVHYGSVTEHYRSIMEPLCYVTGLLRKILILPIQHRMHSSTACASCTMPTADESSYSANGTLHPHHFSPLTHQSLTLTFTLNLTQTPFNILIPIPPLDGTLQALM